MKNLQGISYLFGGLLLGVGLCALLVWNPLEWRQADRLLGRPAHSHVPAALDGGETSDQTLYTCGMHPQVVQHEPGRCPICDMQLVPKRDAAPSPPATDRKILYWRAPMDPSYTSDQPGQSPMGMDLVPVYADEAASESGVRVSRSFLQNFAVRTAEVEQGSLAVEIRTVGILAHDEQNVVSVNTKFEGWIERARVNNVGERVSRGDVLFEIYSPALVATQREFLAAIDYAEQLAAAEAYPDAVERARSLVEAGRERLRYWDVTDAQIEALERTRQVRRTVVLVAPASGVVVGKQGDSLEGMMVSPGMTVLKLADHSKLWAEVEFYEDDIRHVREGTPVLIEVDAFPGRRWRGKVSLLRPALDPETRTLTALVEVSQPGSSLRPGMYANVTVRSGGVAGAALVPAQAVLHSGERAVVIVAKGGGLFEPREVTLGLASGDRQQVVSGLTPGEEIVTSSQFLIDSESNLRAAIAQLLGGREQDDDAPATPPMGRER